MNFSRNLNKFFNVRNLALLGIAFVTTLLLGAYVLEYYFYIAPCSLCLLQRVIFFAIALVLLPIAILPKHKILVITCSVVAIFLALIGIFLAGRQIWLQNLSLDTAPECTFGLIKLLERQPIMTALRQVIIGTSDCAKIDMKLFYLPLSHWSLLAFIILCIISALLTFVTLKRNNGKNLT